MNKDELSLTLFSTCMVGTEETGLLFSGVAPITTTVVPQVKLPLNWITKVDIQQLKNLIESSPQKRHLRKTVDEIRQGKTAVKNENLPEELVGIIRRCLIIGERPRQIIYYKCKSDPYVFALKQLDNPSDSYVSRLLDSIIPGICLKEGIELMDIKRLRLILHDKDVPNEYYHKDIVSAKQEDINKWRCDSPFTDSICQVIFFQHGVNGFVQILKTRDNDKRKVSDEVSLCIDEYEAMQSSSNPECNNLANIYEAL